MKLGRLCCVALLALSTQVQAYRDTRPFVARLFWEPQISSVLVSPSGEWIAARVANSRAEGVLIQHAFSGTKKAAYASLTGLRYIVWIGDSTLFIQRDGNELPRAVALQFDWEDGAITEESDPISAWGSLVDPLPHIDREVLWAVHEGRRSLLYRGSIESFRSDHRARKAKRVASHRAPLVAWFADAQGEPRALFRHDGEWDGTASIRYRNPGQWRWMEVWTGPVDEDMLHPLALTSRGDRLLVAARAGQNTLGLYEFDPESRKLQRALFRHPDFDVVDVVQDYDRREVIAAVYEQDGVRQHVYLNGFRDRHLEGIESLVPDPMIEVTSSNHDHRYFTILGHGPRNPGTFFFYDKRARSLTELGNVIDHIPQKLLADVRSLDVVSSDGTHLEAFLALPTESGHDPPPLLVFPHGGPIDVRDDVSFDPLLQFLAIHGFAVLKVNYRGSSGYGKAFLDAGRRQWSKGIEDDIDAAVTEVIRRGSVDPDRICIAGNSYGGYSALVSAIRNPERYRCAASLNGPTDLLLMFQSSDFAATEAGRAGFAEIVGDPDTEPEALLEISPAYQVDRLERPVLIAHSTEDRRVDPDHAYRMRAMLELHGKPYRWFVIDGAGHSPSLRQYETYSWTLLDFLEEHLGPERRAPRP